MLSRESEQYRRLVRHFASRLFDSDVIARGGDLRETIVTVVALLAASGIAVAFVIGQTIAHSPNTPAIRESLLWANREFLLSLSMVFTAVLSIVSWDSIFPDRTDCMVLGQMPLESRVVMAAKLTTLLGAFAITVAAANAVTTLIFPLVSVPAGKTLAMTCLAHIAAIVSASAFVYFFFLGLQACLVHLLPFRHWKRISAWIQLAAMFTVLFGFFLVPPISAPGVLTNPEHLAVISYVPSFWFLGLYESILSAPDPVLHWLARRAVLALAACFSIAIIGYLSGYTRHVRKTIEESGAVLETRRHRLRWMRQLIDRLLVPDPYERAIFWYVWRTMFRNRLPRMMLAAYASIGLVYVVNGLAGVLKSAGTRTLAHPGAALSAFPLILPFFLVLGMRVLFTYPMELGSNWIFRLVGEGEPVAPLRAVRKVMVAAGIVPVCAVSLPMYGLLWGWRVSLFHVLLSLLVNLVALQMLTTGFYKIPFTCTFMPGKANLKAMFAIYAVMFLVFAFAIVNLELWLLGDLSRSIKGALIAAAILAWAAWRRRRDETGVAARLVYEERANWQLNTLELT